jgi:hypothetical protein
LTDAFALAGLQNLLKYAHVVLYPTGPPAQLSGLRALTWSLTPHSPDTH